MIATRAFHNPGIGNRFAESRTEVNAVVHCPISMRQTAELASDVRPLY